MIPFIDLKAQYKLLEGDIQAGINGVLEHGKFILGPEVAELEKRLAEFAGANHAITCASGTDALLMPLMALHIGPGDIVFTTPFTFIATAEVISLLGATPVFVDVDPRTFNMDPARLQLAVRAVKERNPGIHPLPGNLPPTPVPRAVIPVDLFGLAADYDPINEIARRENLFILEDAAQGFGGIYKGRNNGVLGNAGAVSFFPAKPLGCYGDGGAIFTNDDELARKLYSIRTHGQGEEKYENIRIGLNARLDTLQAAILLPKLRIFPRELAARQRVAELYTDRLQAAAPDITPPYIPAGLQSAWAQYSILCDNRDALQAALKEAAIPSMIYYPKPLHRQKAYAGLGYRESDFPVAESTCRRILSLPMHPYLQEDQLGKIADVIRKFFSQQK
jgi:UDP-2-acetamido-2-deoxy-ribo-hexuluronate aminotransferase